jgi:hypothetical protein
VPAIARFDEAELLRSLSAAGVEVHAQARPVFMHH